MTEPQRISITVNPAQRWRIVTDGISRLVLILPILILVMVGVRHITDPVHATAPVGVSLATPEALTDTRVVGGITFGLVFVLLWALISRDRLRIGHGVVIALMASVLGVRFFGFAEDGTTLAMGTQKVKAGGEALFLLLNSIGFALQAKLGRKLRIAK